jgi:hypothetical protein
VYGIRWKGFFVRQSLDLSLSFFVSAVLFFFDVWKFLHCG